MASADGCPVAVAATAPAVVHDTTLRIADAKLAGKALDRSEPAMIVLLLTVISLGYFGAALARSSVDHFLMDEVLALTAARQTSLAQIWAVIWAGTDFSPPTYHFLLHGFVKTVGSADGRLVWRLPSILAVYGAAVCTYLLIVKSGLSRVVAVLGFAVVEAFVLFDFAIRVRQYGLLAFGLALALLLWHGIDDPRFGRAKACGLWMVLAGCLCLHFYGVVAVATIGAAELIYWVTRRRFRIAVWTALFLTLPVEAALYPLAAHLATFNAADNLASAYYAKPTLTSFGAAVFATIGGPLGAVFLLAIVVTIAAADVIARTRRRHCSAPRRLAAVPAAPLSELEIVMVALTLLPLVTFGFSFFVTHSFSARYMASGALLPALAAAYMVDKLPCRRAAAMALVPALLAVLVMRARVADPTAGALAVLQKAQPAVPVVVGEGALYIELMEAANATIRSKLVYLRRPEGAVSPDPTNENEVVRLAAFHRDYQVSGQDAFLAGNASFYVLHRPAFTIDTTTPALLERGVLAGSSQRVNGIVLLRSRALAGRQDRGAEQ